MIVGVDLCASMAQSGLHRTDAHVDDRSSPHRRGELAAIGVNIHVYSLRRWAIGKYMKFPRTWHLHEHAQSVGKGQTSYSSSGLPRLRASNSPDETTRSIAQYERIFERRINIISLVNTKTFSNTLGTNNSLHHPCPIRPPSPAHPKAELPVCLLHLRSRSPTRSSRECQAEPFPSPGRPITFFCVSTSEQHLHSHTAPTTDEHVRLLASPGGLSAFLSTFNYTLYLLTYLESKSAPLQARLYSLLSKITGQPQPAVLKAGVEAQSRIAALGTLLSSARVTLRLFGLLPMYAWMRQLMQGPKPGQDEILYATSVAQCSLYMTFQFLENVGVLTTHKILPESYTARWTAASGGTPAKIYLWAYRAWFAGVACDFVRLGREAQLENAKRASRSSTDVSTREADNKVDAKWWSEMIVPIAWTPVAMQFSTEGGLSWFNLGIMGTGGMLAGLGRTASLWAATAEQ